MEKQTPDEVLDRLGQPTEGRYGSWHTELVLALREAIQQRDELQKRVDSLEQRVWDLSTEQ